VGLSRRVRACVRVIVIEFSKIETDDSNKNASVTSLEMADENRERDERKKSEATRLRFAKDPIVKPDEFERTWQQSEQSTRLWSIFLKTKPKSEEDCEMMIRKTLLQLCVICLASGSLGNGFQKFFFYAKEDSSIDGSLFMMELNLSLETLKLSCVFRTEDPTKSQAFQRVVSEAILRMDTRAV